MQADVSEWPKLGHRIRNAFCYKHSPYWIISLPCVAGQTDLTGSILIHHPFMWVLFNNSFNSCGNYIQFYFGYLVFWSTLFVNQSVLFWLLGVVSAASEILESLLPILFPFKWCGKHCIHFRVVVCTADIWRHLEGNEMVKKNFASIAERLKARTMSACSAPSPCLIPGLGLWYTFPKYKNSNSRN